MNVSKSQPNNALFPNQPNLVALKPYAPHPLNHKSYFVSTLISTATRISPSSVLDFLDKYTTIRTDTVPLHRDFKMHQDIDLQAKNARFRVAVLISVWVGGPRAGLGLQVPGECAARGCGRRPGYAGSWVNPAQRTIGPFWQNHPY